MRPARIAVVVGVVVGLLLVTPGVVFASDNPAVMAIRPGPLFFMSSADGLIVVDATGSGAGWHVVASVTGGTGYVASARAVMCGAGSTCSLPRSEIVYPETITSSPVTIAEAAVGTGLGTIMTGLVWNVAGSVTVQIVSGP